MKILIVDDNTEDRTILRLYLAHFASEVLEAADGAEALDIVRAERPDLIISDAMMPVMDGFELLREIRRSDDLDETPFIFYSAVYTGGKDEELAISLGADAFMVKPMELESFMKQLKQLLSVIDRSDKRVSRGLLEEDEQYLRKYSQVTAARLEEKVRELELVNRRLLKNETRYQTIFNSIRDVIIIIDQAGVILDVNQPALRETFGYENGETVGEFAGILFDYQGGADLINNDMSLLPDTGRGEIRQVDLRRKGGEHFAAELYVTELEDGGGDPVGSLLFVRDLTRQGKLWGSPGGVS